MRHTTINVLTTWIKATLLFIFCSACRYSKPKMLLGNSAGAPTKSTTTITDVPKYQPKTTDGRYLAAAALQRCSIRWGRKKDRLFYFVSETDGASETSRVKESRAAAAATGIDIDRSTKSEHVLVGENEKRALKEREIYALVVETRTVPSFATISLWDESTSKRCCSPLSTRPYHFPTRKQLDIQSDVSHLEAST